MESIKKNYVTESKIMDDIILDINEGRYEVDEKLPSANELADKYKVSRIKIRQVYDRLESMGYVYLLQGRGCYLKKRDEHINLVLSGKESFSKKMKESGYTLESKNIICERIPYNKYIYNELKAKREDEIYKIGRLRIINGEPTAIHISYINKKIFPNIYEDGKNITSIFEYYKEHGYVDYITEKSILSITYPTLKERSYLNCGELVPLMKLESNCIDKKTKVVLEYSQTMYRGDKFKYEIN